MSEIMSVCIKGFRQPQNRYGSHLRCIFLWVLRKFLTILMKGTSTIPREIAPKIINLNGKIYFFLLKTKIKMEVELPTAQPQVSL